MLRAIFPLFVVLNIVGCEARLSNPSETSTKEFASNAFDAGIVFRDRSNYLCLPFERIGLDDWNKVTSVKTSCECVEGSIVEYKRGQGKVGKAVYLEFKRDEELTHPAAFEVIVLLTLGNAELHEIKVSALSTQLNGP